METETRYKVKNHKKGMRGERVDASNVGPIKDRVNRSFRAGA
jgi:hypothetical protein